MLLNNFLHQTFLAHLLIHIFYQTQAISIENQTT
jgi:hypothetical protein